MAVTNVSTYASLQGLLQNMGLAQNNLNNDQIAISSGFKSQTFDGINGSIDQLTSLNSQIARLSDYQQNNSIYTSQLQASNTILGQIEQLTTGIKNLIAGQMSGTASTASFQQQLQSNLTSLTSELNSTFQGKYLFGGTATNTPPIMSPVPTPVKIGVPDTSYYQGAAQDSTTRVGDGQVITNGIRADNPAFQSLFAGIAQALQPNAGITDLTNAENLVDSGLQGVIALQATVNANIVNVQQVDTQSQSLQTYYTSLSTGMTQADVVSLSTQVAQDQTVLEASFEAYSRISSLSLANFLK